MGRPLGQGGGFPPGVFEVTGLKNGIYFLVRNGVQKIAFSCAGRKIAPLNPPPLHPRALSHPITLRTAILPGIHLNPSDFRS